MRQYTPIWNPFHARNVTKVSLERTISRSTLRSTPGWEPTSVPSVKRVSDKRVTWKRIWSTTSKPCHDVIVSKKLLYQHFCHILSPNKVFSQHSVGFKNLIWHGGYLCKDFTNCLAEACVFQNRSGTYSCTVCGYEASGKQRLVHHVEAKHLETQGSHCDICQKSCRSKMLFLSTSLGSLGNSRNVLFLVILNKCGELLGGFETTNVRTLDAEISSLLGNLVIFHTPESVEEEPPVHLLHSRVELCHTILPGLCLI